MHRALYLAGVGYLAICGAVVVRHQTRPSQPESEPATGTVGFAGPASQWFAAMKPFCNALEVEIAHSRHPAPATLEGQSLSAACAPIWSPLWPPVCPGYSFLTKFCPGIRVCSLKPCQIARDS